MHSLAQSPQDLIVSGTIIDTHRCTPLNPVKLIMKINHQVVLYQLFVKSVD